MDTEPAPGATPNSPTATTGTLRVLIHDGPVDEVDEVWVAFEEVTVHHDQLGWLVVSNVEQEIDLLTLQDGVMDQLGLASLDVGTYSQIRLHLVNSWVVVDGVEEPLTVPSGEQSGLKIGHEFEIVPCGTTTLELDWDLGAHLLWNQGQGYKLRPTIEVTSSVDPIEDCDGDGWSVDDGDCDDSDPTIYPGATDIPNDGIDQDCDGADAVDGIPAGNLIAYWPLDTDTDDYSGNGHHGTPSNLTPATGVQDGCYEFNGDSSNITVPDHADLDLTTPHTIMLWFRAASIPPVYSYDLITKNLHGQSQGWMVNWRDTSELRWDWYPVNNMYSDSAWGAGVWHHVAVTYDGAVRSIYIDGALDGESTSGPTNTNGADVVIGHHANGTPEYWFDGLIDEVVIYGEALDGTVISSYVATVQTLDQDADGYTATDGDCDDGDPAIHPHAGEIPLDGTDQDCDGLDYCVDLDCDGWTDIVFSTYLNNAFQFELDSTIYWGSEAGYSAANRTGLPTVGADASEIADLDGDGYLDIIFSNNVNNADNNAIDSYIYWGDAGGYTVGNRTGLPTLGARGITAADLDDDGYPDLVFTNSRHGNSYEIDSYIYWGGVSGYSTGDRTGLPTIFGIGNSVEDLDNDGYLDIVFSNSQYLSYNNPPSYIYWGSGTGYSTADREELPTTFATGNAIADLDDDGYLDVVFGNLMEKDANPGDYTIDSYVYWNDPAGFDPADRELLPTMGGTGVAIGDVDGDGYLDVALANAWNHDVGSREINSYIYLGSGTGLDASNRLELPTSAAKHVAIADLDGDGYPDVVYANQSDNTGNYLIDSFIYWGTPTGYSTLERTSLPTTGARYVSIAGPDVPVVRMGL